MNPSDEGMYDLIIDQIRMLYKESVKFQAINCPTLESFLSYNNLTTYIENINQVRIYKSDLAQFYLNLDYNIRGLRSSQVGLTMSLLSSLLNR